MSLNIQKSEYPTISKIDQKCAPDYFLDRARFHAKNGKRYWLVDGITDEKRYFSSFDDETRKFASGFCKLGLSKGDVVLYMNKDVIKHSIMLVGVWRANGILRATYPEDDAHTIHSRVLESKVKFLICDEDTLDTVLPVIRDVDWKVNVITINRSNEKQIPSLQQFIQEDDGNACPELLVTEDDPALILSTSGTTGLPKGAVHTHKGVLYMIRSMERVGFINHKLNMVAVKATHMGGTFSGLALMAQGKTGVVMSSVTLENILFVAHNYKPGFLFALTTFLVSMANSHGTKWDFSSIEVVLTGGAPVTPAIQQSLRKLPNLTDIIVLYGMTEALTVATSAVLKDDAVKNCVRGIRGLPDFSIGKVFPDTKLQIRDLTTNEELGVGKSGEICIQSPSLFKEYLNNPNATKEAFVDGYLRTGDVGYFDEHGFVYVVDRIKEIFKYCGSHVAPTELEHVIAEHPNVAEVYVVGIPHELGHVPRAFVRLTDSSIDRMQAVEDIRDFADQRLASYKHLRGGVIVLDDFPKGKSGKVSKICLVNYS